MVTLPTFEVTVLNLLWVFSPLRMNENTNYMNSVHSAMKDGELLVLTAEQYKHNYEFYGVLCSTFVDNMIKHLKT